jgi:hypothetical protein
LDWDHVKLVSISKVRILDGEYAGVAGWAAAKQVRK